MLPRVLARLHSLSAADLSLYPQREVGERLVANFLGIAPEQVLLTNGRRGAIRFVFKVTSAPKTNCFFADPTFVMYPRWARRWVRNSCACKPPERPDASRRRFSGSQFRHAPG